MLVRYGVALILFPAFLAQAQKTTPDIYRDANPAVVEIEGEQKSGSGFMISSDGIVVTNYHVVAGEKTVSVRLTNGLELTTDEVLAEDQQLDIVILHINGKGFPKLRIGDSARVSPGDSVVVIGNPLGLNSSVSEGLISGIREIDGMKLLQISAPISPGSSGGPVLNHAGDVIGVVRATIVGGQNLNLAIPANVVTSLMATGGSPKLLSALSASHPKEGVDSSNGSEIQKAARYLAAHLYSEARDQLKVLLQGNEFDPGLQFAMGETAFRMEEYAEAAHRFEVAQRLDKNFWQAAERQADAEIKIWEGSKNIAARITASQLYDQLSKAVYDSKLTPPQAAMLIVGIPAADDLDAARARASKQLALLMSPVGTWRTDDGRVFKVTFSSEKWWLSSEDRIRNRFDVSFHLEGQASALKLVGDGYSDDSSCMTKISVEVYLSDFSTKVRVDGYPTSQSVMSPSYHFRTFDDSRSMTRICQKMMGGMAAAGIRAYQINLTRTE